MSDLTKEQLGECFNCPSQGKCCYFNVPIKFKDKVYNIYSTYACPYLSEAGFCTRFETRHEVPWCGTVEDKNIKWPSFCPHLNPEVGPAVNAEFIGMLYRDFDLVKDIQKQVDDIVRSAMLERFGVTLDENTRKNNS
jgi:uncharacterized cysteine cluster protein YcgN (CxxCxxCC family)